MNNPNLPEVGHKLNSCVLLQTNFQKLYVGAGRDSFLHFKIHSRPSH